MRELRRCVKFADAAEHPKQVFRGHETFPNMQQVENNPLHHALRKRPVLMPADHILPLLVSVRSHRRDKAHHDQGGKNDWAVESVAGKIFQASGAAVEAEDAAAVVLGKTFCLFPSLSFLRVCCI